MKNNQIILAVLATSLLLGQPMVAQEQSQPKRTSRLKQEYEIFKGALKCVRQKGLRGCTRAQKKRLMAAGMAVIGIIGVGVLGYRVISTQQMPPEVSAKEDDDTDEKPIEIVSKGARELKREKLERKGKLPPISGGITQQPVFTETFEGGRPTGVRSYVGKAASYSVAAPPVAAPPRSPSVVDKAKGWLQRGRPERKKVPERRLSSQPEQPEQVFPSLEALQRASDEAHRAGKPFRGKVKGLVFTSPEEFQRAAEEAESKGEPFYGSLEFAPQRGASE